MVAEKSGMWKLNDTEQYEVAQKIWTLTGKLHSVNETPHTVLSWKVTVKLAFSVCTNINKQTNPTNGKAVDRQSSVGVVVYSTCRNQAVVLLWVYYKLDNLP